MCLYPSLEDNIVLVTGGLGGIGQKIVQAFLENKSIVYVGFRSLNKELESIYEETDKCHLFQTDISKSSEVKNMFEHIKNEHGKIDVLVNNAGLLYKGPIIGTSEMDWDTINNTNLKGTFLCSKAAARMMMRSKRGKIINITSTIIEKAITFQSAYAATKYGIKGMTIAMAKELGRYGICVNGVSPGPISTNMNKITKEVEEQIIESMPLGKMVQAEDVANVVLFLASSQANKITGQVISVDGGLSL